MGTILIIVLILLLIGGLPVFPHSRSWGYGPSGIIGTVLIILLILVVLGKIERCRCAGLPGQRARNEKSDALAGIGFFFCVAMGAGISARLRRWNPDRSASVRTAGRTVRALRRRLPTCR